MGKHGETVSEQARRLLAEGLSETINCVGPPLQRRYTTDSDIYLDETRFGMARSCGPVRHGPRNMPGPVKPADTSGPADFEFGDIRPPGGVVLDPDGYVVSVETFIATGDSWKPFRAHVSGDCAGPGDL